MIDIPNFHHYDTGGVSDVLGVADIDHDWCSL